MRVDRSATAHSLKMRSFRSISHHWFTVFVRIVGLCAALTGAIGAPQPVRAAEPWLFVNDVHFDPTSRRRSPVTLGHDPNPALLDSALNEMRRVAPHPPVVVMAGDFLAHHIKNESALPTMLDLAKRFDRVFPHAQFVIALGNEDSECGDYAMPPGSAFLRSVAKAWAPLVNRNGAAPHFLKTFARDGFYTARLPVAGLRAVVVDNAFWSPLYHNGCGSHGDPTPASFGELDRALRPGANERRWLIMHIPPGIDASSTVHLVHHLAIVPFMRPGPRDAVLAFIGDPARHVDLVVTGHVHHFSFRIIERAGTAPVPLIVAPAISPILGNLPSFLTAAVARDGVIRNLEEYSFVERKWRNLGGTSTLGASEVSGPALVHLQHRLERDPELRERFATLYTGDSPYHEITSANWRSYWCVASEFSSTAFRDCVDEGGFSFLTRRGVLVVGVALGSAVLVVVGILVAVVVARRRTAARSPR